ncbi:restriction endonuclease [Anderseniella sp. Alg231-50]|uniref:restriction endonuclease n=1 Tax=Anderseniella sp. Alg231-50 TaxID=1922226 RepID=UPI000D561F3D
MPTKIYKIRTRKMEKQSGLCYYCGQPMWLRNALEFAKRFGLSCRQAAQFRCTAEHLTARQDQGGNGHRNIVAACLYCNGHRHRKNKPPAPAQFRSYVRRRLAHGKWHGFINR